ncbi:MAG TPA: nuclear transport factor 2 family protein [Kofleriaceae bacterium]|nr:nuclear transport factor 2 family protein [Kofleriaceae bacterium]
MTQLGERLRDALVALTPDNAGAVEGLAPLYDPAMVFRDPIQTIRGREEFLAMNRRLLRRMRRLTWDVTAVQGTEDEVFLEWRMQCGLRLGPSLDVDGTTRVRARGGLIVDHRDYWDLGEMIASALPGGQRLLNALRAPLA